MGRFRFLTVALLLIQVLTTRASQAQFDFGEEHLDSGQTYDRPDLTIQDDSSFESDDDSLGGDDEYFHVIEDVRDEGDEQQYDYEYENYDDWNNYDEKGVQEKVEVSYLPLKRVRRRIIPVGKAIDRDRGAGDRTGNGRTRSEWAQAPKTTDVSRRSGPTGSAALFSLYPELAPPELRDSYQNKKRRVKVDGKKSKKEERDTKAREEKNKKNKKNEMKEVDEVGSIGGSETPKVSRNGKKKRVRLSKEMKEEIAMYANEHGVDKATSHFRTKLDAPLKTVAVEKFLRRYQNRQVRRGDRKENKGLKET